MIAKILGLSVPADPTQWHHWHVLIPRRTINGKFSSGFVWRRQSDNGWQYKRITETEQDWWDRQY